MVPRDSQGRSGTDTITRVSLGDGGDGGGIWSCQRVDVVGHAKVAAEQQT